MAVPLQMVVVPDNATAKKLPSVEGMMVYRKDSKKVYVLEDKKLSALAKENEVGYEHDFLVLIFIDRSMRCDLRTFNIVLRLRILQRVLLGVKFEDIGYFFTLGHDLAKSKLNYHCFASNILSYKLHISNRTDWNRVSKADSVQKAPV